MVLILAVLFVLLFCVVCACSVCNRHQKLAPSHMPTDLSQGTLSVTFRDDVEVLSSSFSQYALFDREWLSTRYVAALVGGLITQQHDTDQLKKRTKLLAKHKSAENVVALMVSD